MVGWGVGVGMEVGVGTRVGVRVGVGEGIGDGVGLELGDGLVVSVGVGLWVASGVRVGEEVGVGGVVGTNTGVEVGIDIGGGSGWLQVASSSAPSARMSCQYGLVRMVRDSFGLEMKCEAANFHKGRVKGGSRYSCFFKSNEAELMQYLLPVGAGPSGNTCPRCASHETQRTSIRCVP